MRLRTATALLAFTVAATVASCSQGPTATPDAASTDKQTCEGFVAWATTKLTDDTQPVVRDYFDLLGEPERFSTAQKVAIRRAYFSTQEKAIRSLAATSTDTRLRDALQDFADGWAERAANTSDAGPRSIQPDRAAIAARCPGLTARIDEVAKTHGK